MLFHFILHRFDCYQKYNIVHAQIFAHSLIFQPRNEPQLSLGSIGSVGQCNIAVSARWPHAWTDMKTYNPCFVATDVSVFSSATKEDVIRALSHLHTSTMDKLPYVAHWALHGTWPGNQALRVGDGIQPNIYRICQFLHLAVPTIALHINDNLVYGIVDSGAKLLLLSKPYLDQICPGAEIASYNGRPFRQADSSPLPVAGEYTCTLQIGTISSTETFIIFEAPSFHRECLIGFQYLQSKNVFIGNDGLYLFPPSVLRPSSVQQDFPRCELGGGAPVNRICAPANKSDLNEHGDLLPPRAQGRGTTNGDLTFPIYACEAITILPSQSLLIKCRLQGLKEEDMCQFGSGHMVCSSEQLEPYQSLTKLSIFYQIIPITEHNQTIELLYYNNQHDPAFINEKQIIAFCEPMKLADDEEMEAFSKMNPACYFVGHVSGASQTKASSLCSPNFDRFEFDPNEFTPSISEQDPNVCCEDPVYKDKFIKLVQSHADVYGNSPWSVNSWGSPFDLKARESQVPFQAPIIPVAPRVRRQAAELISTLLEKGMIQYSKSPYRSSVLFLVKKSTKNQHDNNSEIPMSSIRMVLDMRRMSAQLLQNWPAVPIPLITDVLGYLRGMKVVTIQDFSQGFFGIRLRLGRHLTAFQFSGALYEFCSLPQGTSPSSAVFQRAVAHLLKTNKLDPDSRRDKTGNIVSGAINFIDDLVLFSRDLDTHYTLLQEVFEVLSKHKIKLKISKSQIAEEKNVTLLGYDVHIKAGTIGPARKHIDRLIRLKPPSTLRGVRKTIGMFSFFSSLIPNFATKMGPLFDMLRLDKKFHFGEKEKAAFDFMVSSLAKFPVVYIIDVTKALYTVCDGAAGDSISYIIMQYHAALSSFVPCRFISHRLNRTQQNYPQVQAEVLSISTFCAENYSLLLYRKSYIYNDSHALSYISHFRWHNAAIFRHHLLISSLNLHFIWTSSDSYIVSLADLLTRPALKRNQSHQRILKQRISRELVDNLPYVSMHGLPELSYEQAITLLDKFNALCTKLGPKNLAEKWKALIQVAMPNPPPISARSQDLNINVYHNQNNNISQEDFLQCCTRISTYSTQYQYGYPIFGEGVTNMIYICAPSTPISHPPPILPPPDQSNLKRRAAPAKVRGRGGRRGAAAARNQEGREVAAQPATRHTLPPHPPSPAQVNTPAQGIASFLQAQGKLEFYFPGCHIHQLILEQNKDEKLQKLSKDYPQDFKKIKGVLCKVTKYQGVTYLPIAWPQHLAVALLKRAHVVNSILHLRLNRVEHHLRPFFHIRNLKKEFDNMKCDFCIKNIKQRQDHLPFGLSFNVSQTRSFLSIDICVIQSNVEYGSFLQILDICSYFCIAVKCKSNPTAREVHEIIWTYWVPWAGTPLCVQYDNGINQSLGHEIAQYFNCREFFITPLNSKSARSERVHALLLNICRGANKMGYITGDNFQLWLSLAALLHNSTRNIHGFAPSQLMFSNFPSRTHQFIGMSDLQRQQSKSYFAEQMREAAQYLSLIALKRKELNLKKAKIWETYRQRIHCGDLVLKQRTEVRKALWKLKPKYKDVLYRVVATRRNYCILLPLSSLLDYVKSPFHKGGKPVQRYERSDRKFLKLISDPFEYLGLSRARQDIEAAAEILGQHVPVKHIRLGPPNPVTKTHHEFYRLFATPHPVSSCGSKINHDQEDNDENKSQLSDLCFSSQPSFLKQIRTNKTRIDNFVRRIKTHVNLDKESSPFLPLEGNTHYVFKKSCFSWERSYSPVTPAPTVPYQYTALYKADRLRRMKHRLAYLRDVQSSPSDNTVQGAEVSAAEVSNDPLHGLSKSQLKKVSKSFLHLKKSEVFPLILSSLESLAKTKDENICFSTSSSSSPRRMSVVSSRSQSRQASTGSSSASMHSVKSGASNNLSRDEVDEGLLAGEAPVERDVQHDPAQLDLQQDDLAAGTSCGEAEVLDRLDIAVTHEQGGAISAIRRPQLTGIGSNCQQISDLPRITTMTTTTKAKKEARSTRSCFAPVSSPGSRADPSSPTSEALVTRHAPILPLASPLLSRSPPFSPRDRSLVRPPLTPDQATEAASPAQTLRPPPTLKNQKSRTSVRLKSRKE